MSLASPSGNKSIRMRLVWFLSPVPASVLSLIVGLSAVAVPPGFYESVIGEPNFVFADFRVVAFLIIMWSAFMLGMRFSRMVRSLSHKRKNARLINSRQISPKMFEATTQSVLLVMAVVIPVAAYINVTVTSSLASNGLVQALSGATSVVGLRNNAISDVADAQVGWAFHFTIAVVVLGYWTKLFYVGSARSSIYTAFNVLFYTLAAITLVNVVLYQTRGLMLYLGFALVLIRVYHTQITDRARLGHLLRVVALYVCVAVSVALLFAVLRERYVGGSTVNEVMARQFVGYYTGSYNRLAALLQGELKLPGAGFGYYATEWFWQFPLLSSILDFQGLARDWIGQLPPSGWEQRYPYMIAYGLNPQYTALTVFAHAFVDFGWFACLWFFVYGIASAELWRLFLRGNTVGVVLYPYTLWSILEWRGYMDIARRHVVVLATVAVLVFIIRTVIRALPSRYEMLLTSNKAAS